MEQVRKTKREYWTSEEDATLIQYITAHGTGNWEKAAKCFVDDEGIVRKTGSSCLQRYNDHLAPGLVHGDFTDEEIDTIKTLLALHGKKWAFIASQLDGRTGNSVKNWYHKREAKKARELKQALAAAPAGGPTIGGNLYDGDGPGVDVSNLHEGEGGDAFEGFVHHFLNQQFLNSGAGFGDYNQQIANSRGGGGAGFGDYNHQFANSGGAGDYNQQLAGAGFGDYSHQIANSGSGFGDYNQQLAGAGFGDYNQRLAGVGFGGYNQQFDDELLWDFNDQKFINNNCGGGGGGGADAGATTDDDLAQYLNYLSTTPSHNPPSA